jgi:polysaccharide export outer membrane protein
MAGGCITFDSSPGNEPFARYVPAGGGIAPSMTDWAPPTTADGSGTNAVTSTADGNEERLLRSGDRIVIQLRGITPPVELTDEIDDTGSVNLEHIGRVAIAGLTTSEAERRVESAYIDGQFYTKIAVTIVAERDEYYVRGEVRNPGRFPLARGMTLTMALAAAGGYTDYAKRSKVRIIRGRGAELANIDADQVEKRQAPDPIIHRGDTIIVDARVL